MSFANINYGPLGSGSVYIGVNFADILYGVELVLYFKTIRVLRRNGGLHKKSNLFYALFSSAMVLLATVWLVDYIMGDNLTWYSDMASTAFILLQLITDGLMIYRCYVVWNGYCVVSVPTILWLSTLVLGVFVDWADNSTSNSFFNIYPQLSFAYYAVSVPQNTILACMICYRVLRHGRSVKEHLGKEYASLYFGVVTFVIQAVLPYTVSGVGFLVSLGAGSLMSGVFLPVYVLMMCISTQTLILRVVGKRAWNTSICPISTIRFNPGNTSAPQQMDTDLGPGDHLQRLSNAYIPGGRGGVVISPV